MWEGHFFSFLLSTKELILGVVFIYFVRFRQ